MTVIIVTGHSTPFEMDYYRYPFGSMYLTFFFFIELDFKACLNEATLFGRNCRMSSLRRSNRLCARLDDVGLTRGQRTSESMIIQSCLVMLAFFVMYYQRTLVMQTFAIIYKTTLVEMLY
ncbi:hypothetical protein BGY98DRAFT_476528 [Russula aff. rugulosa BPL654]|nr:hypothetical protein BGY98DRAFT_476528 [Russula aff. rugulosa BPL654]